MGLFHQRRLRLTIQLCINAVKYDKNLKFLRGLFYFGGCR